MNWKDILDGFLVGYNINEPSKVIIENMSLFVPGYAEEGYAEYYEAMFGDKSNVIDPIMRPHYKEANELGMTHWSFGPYADAMTIEYNVGDHPKLELYGEPYGYDMAKEYAERRNYDYVFVYDDYDGLEEITLPNWKNRDKAKNKTEALQYLASYISEVSLLNEEDAKETVKFAKKWGIPFNPDLHNMTMSSWMIDHPAWNSSGRYC